jgi:hypothetical protein
MTLTLYGARKHSVLRVILHDGGLKAVLKITILEKRGMLYGLH